MPKSRSVASGAKGVGIGDLYNKIRSVIFSYIRLGGLDNKSQRFACFFFFFSEDPKQKSNKSVVPFVRADNIQ